MNMKNRWPIRFIATAWLVIATLGAHATDDIRKETVQFKQGASQATIQARIKGWETVDYVLRAGAGQTLSVALKKTNPQNYFNVLAPGADGAMFVGQSGENFKGVLPTDGDYTIRVYLMRPAARRNESSDYTLTVGVTGKALAPVAASQDALIPGTPFHASTTITCAPLLDPKPQRCEAFVIRRGFDGAATVEVRGPNGFKRRILFVKGDPVASDSQDPMTFSRKGDVSVVKFGADESAEIPDALVRGG